jgi:dTDP-4-dehydrorhamnose reductase
MEILLLGANGQVGWELQRSLAPLGKVKACDRLEANLENLDKIRTLVQVHRPEVIVNAAAYTAVDQAESEQEKAYQINAEAVAVLADEAKRINSWLIHYSTEYVFDGTKKDAYVETDETNPQSVYGKSKLQGEEEIKKSSCKYLIFRTSWVYSTHGANFPKHMIRLAKEQSQLKVVDDQVGAPTSAELIADVTSLCLHRIAQNDTSAQNMIGTYHITPAGETSWHGYTKFIFTEMQRLGSTFRTVLENIVPISTSEYPQPAMRPSNSQLDTQKLRETFNIYLPPWQFHVRRLIKELHTQESG